MAFDILWLAHSAAHAWRVTCPAPEKQSSAPHPGPEPIEGHPVTFWHLIVEGDRKATYGELGVSCGICTP